MSEPFDHVFSLTTHKDNIELVNHLANCFESCMPSQPILNADESSEFITMSRCCTASQYAKWTGIMEGWNKEGADKEALVRQITPKWNTALEKGGDLVDIGKVAEALTASAAKGDLVEAGKVYFTRREQKSTDTKRLGG